MLLGDFRFEEQAVGGGGGAETVPKDLGGGAAVTSTGELATSPPFTYVLGLTQMSRSLG